MHNKRFNAAVFLVALITAPVFSFWQPVEKKLIHAGYPAEVAYIRQHIGAMQDQPFNGTILAIHKLRPLFNYERKVAREDVQP